MTTDTISCFLTDRGIDVVLRDDGNVYRATINYGPLSGVIDNRSVSIQFDDKRDDVLRVKINGLFQGELKLQNAGHFFSYLRPLAPSTPISLAEARARAASAKVPA